MSRKIIAVDFDDTLFTNNWPDVDDPIWPTINKVKEEQANGAAIILWTCRSGAPEAAALKACESVGIIPDAVNANLPELIKAWDGEDTRKIVATEYWDDRAVNMKSPWIPVTERLPEDDLPADSKRVQLKVLVAIRDERGRYTIRTQTRARNTYYRARKFGNWFWGKDSCGDVTHWMPLPENPV